MTTFYQTFFPGTSLPSGFTRRNIVAGDETFNEPGLTVANLNSGDYYLLDCPAGDFSAELEFTNKTTLRMVGVGIVDGSGNGALATYYNSSPPGALVVSVASYAYGGSFENAGGSAGASGRIRITKSGNDYTSAYSSDGGGTWSAESDPLTRAVTPTKVVIGCPLSSGVTIKLVELKVITPSPAAITLDLAATLPLAEAAFSVDVAEPPVTLTLDATLPTTEAAFSVDYTPPPVTLSLDATLPPLSVAFDVDTTHVNAQLAASLPLTQAAFDVTYTPPPVTLTLDATLPTLEAAFDVDTGGVEVSIAASLPMLSAAFDVSYGGPYPTDTSNDANGRGRRGLATVTITRPVAAVPDTLTRATKVEKSIAYPAPTMDNGRPT